MKIKSVLVIDNYDSFVYNIVQLLGSLKVKVMVYRNDKITIKKIKILMPDMIIISPGPCTPNEAGISNEIIRRFSPEIPILGVCLGHQCIGQVFGAKVVKALKPVHGKTSLIYHDGKGVYKHLKS